MKNVIICVLFLFLGVNVNGQKVELFCDFNVGMPNASDLKDLHYNQKLYINNFKSLKTTDDFSYYYGFTTGVRILKKFSLYYSNKVTGAKTSVADYSGYVRLTNELKANSFGIKYHFYNFKILKGDLRFNSTLFITSSTLTNKKEVFYEAEQIKNEFTSIDYGLGAGVSYEYPIYFLTVRAYLGYDHVFGGKLKPKKDIDNFDYLKDKEENKIETGWSGINGGIGILISLSK